MSSPGFLLASSFGHLSELCGPHHPLTDAQSTAVMRGGKHQCVTWIPVSIFVGAKRAFHVSFVTPPLRDYLGQCLGPLSVQPVTSEYMELSPPAPCSSSLPCFRTYLAQLPYSSSVAGRTLSFPTTRLPENLVYPSSYFPFPGSSHYGLSSNHFALGCRKPFPSGWANGCDTQCWAGPSTTSTKPTPA